MKKFLLIALFLSAPAFAGETPVEISASKALEWNRRAQTYTARGSVSVKQDKATLTADTLVAHYAGSDGATDFTMLEAAGNVVLSSAPYVVRGQKAVYDVKQGRATLTGNPAAQNGAYTVTADTLGLFVDANTQPQKITADGHVVIKTTTETVTGDHVVYDLSTQKAVMTGKVMARQGESWLEGTRADVDMKTGISQLSGGGNAKTDGRVKGVFYPKGQKQ